MNTTEILNQAASAREAGFDAAADQLEAKAKLATKLAIAYEHHRFVTQEQVDAFNKKLKDKSTRPATAEDAHKLAHQSAYYSATMIHDELTLVPMNTYKGLPPTNVLEAVKQAKARDCFDSFEVAEVNPVSTKIKLPDPIVFGRVEGCTDRFYVAEWGTDVSISDLLKSHEG